MRSRLKHSVRRAKFAIVGAAVGAGVGGLLSRNAASTCAGVGALVAATIADKTSSDRSLRERISPRGASEEPPSP